MFLALDTKNLLTKSMVVVVSNLVTRDGESRLCVKL